MRVVVILTVLGVGFLARTSTADGQTPAAQSAGAGLTITILEGDNAILDPHQRVSRESIIEVRDENHKPVGGVLLSFSAPNTGASASLGKNQFATLITDNQGRAVLRGIRPNGVPGQFSVRVTASKEGRSASTDLHFTNLPGTPVAATGGGLSAKAIIAIVAGVGVAAGVGIAVGLSGGGAGGGTGVGSIGGQQQPPAVITLQPGVAAVGPPR